MQPTSEMQFGRTDSPSITLATAYPDGQVTLTVQNTEVEGHACDNELSLGQTIQLRDFLNRHIDSFALSATGSLAQRAADDPTQLAAEELLLPLALDAIAPVPIGQQPWKHQPWQIATAAPAGTLHLVWDANLQQCVGFYDQAKADRTACGGGLRQLMPAIGIALREQHVLLEEPLPQTTVTFFG